jgi:hypothetical protein
MNAEPINERPFEPGDTYQGLPVPRAPMALTVAERAAAVFTAIPSEDDLRELAKKSLTITAITNDDGKAQCYASRMVLKNTRLAIARVGEVGREDAVQTSKAIIAIQKARIAVISPEEDRLAAIQKTWDDRIAAEKEAEIQAEIARVNAIHERLAALRGNQLLTSTSGSALIEQHIADLWKLPADESFEEFRQIAADAKTAAISRLESLLTAAVAHETEQAKIKEERAELAKLREEAAERDRLAREAQAKADAEARAERERLGEIERQRQIAEARAHAEELRLQREAMEREAGENRRIEAERRAEAAKAEEATRQALAAETAKLAADRAEMERRLAQERDKLAAEQEAARLAAMPKPKPSKVAPGGPELIMVIANHYQVKPEIAIKWVQGIDWTKVKKVA